MKLTRKQKAFANELIKNPKQSATQAAHNVYDVGSRKSAEVIASENLRNPAIQRYLEVHANKARDNLLEIEAYSRDMGKTFSKEGASYAKVATDINRDVLDRVDGKATQRTEVVSTGVVLTIDLTNAIADDVAK